MHKEGALRRRAVAKWMTVVAVVCVISSAVFATVLTQRQSAHAADLSSSYTWKPVKVGGGGYVTGMAIHPTTANLIYARTDVGGAYKWNESTQSWSQLILANRVPNPTQSDYNVESVAISKTNDQVVYVAVGNDLNNATGRILKSTNQGQSWSDSGKRWMIGGNADARTTTERLTVDPNNGNVVYFGSRKEGLWVSNNGGTDWSQISTSSIPTGTAPAGITYVVIDPNSGTVNGKTKRIYVGIEGQGIYSSNDGGSSWSNILAVTNKSPQTGQVSSDGFFYAAIGEVRKYNPSNNSWTTISPNGSGNFGIVSVDPRNAQRLLVNDNAVRDGHVWRSTNGGANWDTLDVTLASADIPWIVNTDEEGWMSNAQFQFDPHSDRLWFPQGTGMWNTSDLYDSDITWQFVSKGIEEMVATDIVSPPGSNLVVTTADRNGFSLSNPDTYPQRPILTNVFSSGQSLDYSGQNPNFIVAISSDHRGLNSDQSGYSTDGGKNWQQFSGNDGISDLHSGNIAVSATDTNNIVWLPTWNRKPYVSTDRGGNWNKQSFFDNIGGLHGNEWWQQKRALESDKVEGGVFYIYSTDGAFYRSTNSGQSWQQAPGNAPLNDNSADAHVFGQIHAAPGKAGHVWLSMAQNGFYYTENKGDSWTKVNDVQDARAFGFGKTLAGASYPTVFVYGKVNNTWGIYRSSNQGASWDLVSNYPAGLYDDVKAVNGDMNVAGRVYVGFSGNSFVYGDSSSTPPPSTPTATPTATPTPTSGGNTVTINPSDDRDDFSSSTANATVLNVSQWTTSYLKFPLSAANSVSSAKLRVYRPNTPQGALTLKASQATDGWNENSTSFPGAGTLVNSAASSGTGYIEIDVTSYVQAQKSGDGTASFALNTDKGAWDGVYSKDNGSNKPELVITTSGGSSNATLNPSDDRDDYSNSTANGTVLNVSQWTTSYLKFNLSSTGNTISSAKLRVYRPNTPQGSLTLKASQATDGWNENSTSFPGAGSLINSAASSGTGYIEIDVTSYVQAQKSGDGVASFALNTDKGGWDGIYSKDNSSNKPQLVITSN